MRLGRTLPPASAPLSWRDIFSGLRALLDGEDAVCAFESDLRRYFGVRYSFCVSSGKAALTLILDTLHHLSPDRDEVLIPAYTCYSVPSAITRAKLKVRLSDLAAASFDFDHRRLEEELQNPRLLCVVPIHLFGVPANLVRLREMIACNNITIVEDAAQAMGAEWNGRKLGTWGDVSLFSLGRGKALSTCDGGIILTNSDEIGQSLQNRMRLLPQDGYFNVVASIVISAALSFFAHPSRYWFPSALPFLKLGQTHFDPMFPIRKLSPFQAGTARHWQEKIAAFRRARMANTQKYLQSGIMPVGFTAPSLPDLVRLPILVEDPHLRRSILQQSEHMGLGISAAYPDTIAGIAELAENMAPAEVHRAKAMADRLLTLPIHPFVTQSDLDRIISLFKRNLPARPVSAHPSANFPP